MTTYNNTHYFETNTVENYDTCRHVPKKVLGAFSKHILKLTPKRENHSNILDQGAGNGRFLIPLIQESVSQERKDKFYALDQSPLMIADLIRKLEELPSYAVETVESDLQREIPFPDNFFDTAYTFAVYHILKNPERALDETIRTLKQGGTFIFGQETNQVFDGTENRIPEGMPLNPKIKEFFQKYHELREENEIPFQASPVLYSDPSFVINHLKQKGLEHKVIKDPELEWQKPHTLREILDAFKQRNITTLGSEIPESIRTTTYTQLLEFCNSSGYDLDEIIEVPSKITIHSFSRK